MIQVGGTEVHLQIAEHVKRDESHHGDTADGHHIFFAHGRGIHVKKEGSTATPGNRGPGHGDSAGSCGMGHREPTSR